MLIHGDLHYGNILQSNRHYKAIDVKGFIGQNYMDTAQVIHSELLITNSHGNLDEKLAELNNIITLVAECSGFTKELLSQWLFISSVKRAVGGLLYMKNDEQKLGMKINQSELYLKYVQQL